MDHYSVAQPQDSDTLEHASTNWQPDTQFDLEPIVLLTLLLVIHHCAEGCKLAGLHMGLRALQLIND